MEIQLKLFCSELDFNLCINSLRDKLKKTNQIQEYDSIYELFLQENSNYTIDTIITGLSRKIKFITLCKYYANELYPNKKVQEIKNEEWLLSLFDMEFSIQSFLETCYKLSFYPKEIDENDKIPRFGIPENRKCFPYVLLDKAANLSFESVNSLLFEKREYTRIPLGFLLFEADSGPHGSLYTSPGNFFDHDYNHYYIVMKSIEKYNMEDILDFYNRYPIRTIKRRMIDIYLHSNIFEENIKGDKNILDNFDKKFIDIFRIFDEYDIKWIFKYFMESVDINNNELSVDYIEYKKQLEDIEEQALISMHKFHKLEQENADEEVIFQAEDDFFQFKEKLTNISLVFAEKFLNYL